MGAVSGGPRFVGACSRYVSVAPLFDSDVCGSEGRCLYPVLTACCCMHIMWYLNSCIIGLLWNRYRDAELKHGRLAMVALAGWPLATLVLALLTKVYLA